MLTFHIFDSVHPDIVSQYHIRNIIIIHPIIYLSIYHRTIWGVPLGTAPSGAYIVIPHTNLTTECFTIHLKN